MSIKISNTAFIRNKLNQKLIEKEKLREFSYAFKVTIRRSFSVELTLSEAKSPMRYPKKTWEK